MTNVETMKIPEGYKQTEVGVVPEDWQWKLLGQLCIKIQDGNYGESYPKSGEFVEFGVPFLTSKVLGKTGKIKEEKIDFITTEKHELLAKAHLELNDVLFTNRGASVGAIGFADDRVSNGNIGPQLTLLRADSDLLISKYLFHVMKSSSVRRQILNQDSGSAMNFFGIGDTEKFKILFPPSIKEQTAIANALTDVDNLIASLETLIAKKSAIKTAAMQQLLTGKKRLPTFVKESEKRAVKESEKQGAKQSSELDSTSETAQAAQAKQISTLNSDLYKESGEGFDAKSNQHSEVSNANNKQTATRPGYKLTELGEIPENWEVMSIGHALERKLILDQMDGNHGELYPKSYEFSDFGIPYVGATDFHNGKVNFSTCKYLPIERAKLFKKGIAKNSDVLFAHNATVGPVALLESDFEFIILSTTATYYRCDETKINNKYLASYFESQLFVNQYTSVMSQSTRNQVPILTQRKFKLVLPTMIEQTAIANVLSDMDIELDALQQRLSKTQKIKQGMMQELLTGKTRLLNVG